ncbi:MAG: orotate phosphoribosyltransferase [Candidatus Thermoplasmatota archaeon]|nr:orotate phosphoribosyltransferase [Candidatus Thermoplasmatota archaeon]MBS3789905.1 orotate phosphoribosyltransferase [Candidatus Thermoplasmatota archaeon]
MKMLKDMLEECGAIKYGEFTLTSGKKSDYYVDIKLASTRPDILKEIAVQMAEHVDGDKIAGMELGAVPIASAVSLETGLPFLMVRKKKKGHGTAGRIEGEFEEGDKVTVVEDVTTTGGSAVETVKVLREAGTEVEKVLVVVDRKESAEKRLEDVSVELIPLITADELVDE